MYKEFYGLKEDPFSISPDPDFMFWSQKHLAAFRHLMYSIHRKKGLILLTGEIGAGKTTLIHALMKEISDKAKIATIANSEIDVSGLFQFIFHAFGLSIEDHNKVKNLIKLNEFLVRSRGEEKDVVLILDEAHNFSNEVLEEIRLLSNIETPKEKLLQIILVGQPVLLDRINSIGFEQVRQRVGMSYYLRSLSKPETNLYIKKRLEISGAHNSSLFSESAIDEVFNYSKGTPRVINTICDNALLFGAAEKSAHIDAHIVRRVVESLYLQQSVDPHNSMPYDTEDGDSEDTMEGMPRQGEEVSPYVRIAHLQDAHPFDQRPAFGWREQRSRQRLTVFVTAAGLAIVLLSGLLLARVEFVQQALATLTDRLVGYTGKGTESTVQPETKPPADPAARPAPLSPDTSSGLPTPTLVDPGAGKTSPGASRPASTVPVVQDVPVRFVAKPEPEYPPLARRLGWEGTPILLLELRADGTVGEVNVVASSNYPVLDEAAKQAVKKWTHIPPRRDGVAVTQWITQSIPFKLSEAPLVGQNETIRAVQERLKSAGFYPGPVDGLLGPRTREAVLRYQESRSLPVSGEIDKATKTALGLE